MQISPTKTTQKTTQEVGNTLHAELQSSSGPCHIKNSKSA